MCDSGFSTQNNLIDVDCGCVCILYHVMADLGHGGKREAELLKAVHAFYPFYGRIDTPRLAKRDTNSDKLHYLRLAPLHTLHYYERWLPISAKYKMVAHFTHIPICKCKKNSTIFSRISTGVMGYHFSKWGRD